MAKCDCQSCGNRIEFPTEGVGQEINCPHCGQLTVLGLTEEMVSAPIESTIPQADIVAAFKGSIPPTPVSFFYRIGLVLVSLVMVLLPVVYIAMIGAAAFGVYLYATHFTFLLTSMTGGGRVYFFKLICYITPLIAGAIMVFFMIKPLFARPPKRAQPLALNPAVESTLFAFIAQICDKVGAPMPSRIDLDCNLNAAASFRRGTKSFLGNDLVLTIGLPLVAGLNTRQLAGVLAHEFGHFTQGFGMRLSYVIRSINGWFARVVYERDAWDVMLATAAEEAEDWRMMILISCIRFGVWFARGLLMLLMYFGHVVSCFLLRQMEYDADTYEMKLAGSDGFEAIFIRLSVLNESLGRAYKDARSTWNVGKELPENLPAFVMRHESRLPDLARKNIEDKIGLVRSGWFHTHPSDAQRIQRARRAAEPGVFDLELPAAALFANFEAVSKQVTLLHYTEELGLPMEIAKLKAMHLDSSEAKPSEAPAKEPKRYQVPLKTPEPQG